MGYDGVDSIPFDFEPNEILFGSKSKGKLSPRSYPIQCERKWKYNFLSEGWNAKDVCLIRQGNVRHDQRLSKHATVRILIFIKATSEGTFYE